MSCTWPLFCYWTNWHMPPQTLNHRHQVRQTLFPSLKYYNQCVIGMVFIGWVASKWGLMKTWFSTPKRPIFVVHPKWTPSQSVLVGLKVWLCY
jgi:hypothetical protein